MMVGSSFPIQLRLEIRLKPGSWNFYAYVQGDPINFNDPEGLDVNVALDKLAPDRCGVATVDRILGATSYGITAQGAHDLFNSKEGILALSLFFGVRPNGAYYDEDSGRPTSLRRS